MRRLTRAVCVVALGIGTAGCMATGNENAMTLGTLGAVAGGIGGTHVGQGKGRLAATSIGTLLGAATGMFVGNKFDTVNANRAAASALRRQFNSMQQPQPRSSYYPLSVSPSQSTQTHIYNHNSTAGGHNNTNAYNLRLQCHVVRNQVICAGN